MIRPAQHCLWQCRECRYKRQMQYRPGERFHGYFMPARCYCQWDAHSDLQSLTSVHSHATYWDERDRWMDRTPHY